MNSGTIVTNALNRCLLPVNDYAQRDMAYGMLNEIVQTIHSLRDWKFKKARFSFQTQTSIEEYALHKLADSIMLNTLRGTNPVRRLKYEPTHDFYHRRPYELATGAPYFYRDGEQAGVQVQPSASSIITFSSSLSNYTTGTADVLYGRSFALISTGVITLDMLGRFFRVGTDDKRYRIIKVYPISAGTYRIDIDAPYEGTTSTSTAYAIGDIGQKVTVLGLLDNDSVYEEEVQLDGATAVVTIQSFASLVRISKNDKTAGYISATSNSGGITNIVLDPGETQAEFTTIKLYPIPTEQETIEYEAYTKHPYLYKYNDVPLIPNQFHELLVLDLIYKLKSEFLNQTVPQELIVRRSELFEALESWDSNVSDWLASPETEEQTQSERRGTNLPNNYGTDDGF